MTGDAMIPDGDAGQPEVTGSRIDPIVRVLVEGQDRSERRTPIAVGMETEPKNPAASVRVVPRGGGTHNPSANLGLKLTVVVAT